MWRLVSLMLFSNWAAALALRGPLRAGVRRAGVEAAAQQLPQDWRLARLQKRARAAPLPARGAQLAPPQLVPRPQRHAPTLKYAELVRVFI